MQTSIAAHSDKLIYFYEIANSGSLQAASRRIGISPPSLSVAVRQLEDILSTKVFKRTSTGVTLTESGQKLYDFTDHFLKESEKLQDNLHKPTSKVKEKIRIGTFQSIALNFWPLIYESLMDDKQLTASITTDRSQVIIEQLVQKKIDFALTVDSLRRPDIQNKKLYSDQFSFFISSKLNLGKITKEEASRRTLYYFADAKDEMSLSLKQYIRKFDLKFAEECEVDSFELIEKFVGLDYGIGILPMRILKNKASLINSCKIEDVPKHFGLHSFYLSYRRDSELKQMTVQKVLDAAERAVKEYTE
jgi:LysR family transcriptional regulator, cell division regulator